MEELDALLSAISIADPPPQPRLPPAVAIQSWYRGASLRLNRLPMVVYLAQKYLVDSAFVFSNETRDGRTNSCIDEDGIIALLAAKFGDRLRVSNSRMWHDVLLFDRRCGWLPMNIKTTTTATSDNTGNLAMCVHAYTNEDLHLSTTRSYDNGKMSRLLLAKLQARELNRRNKKDYYFVVLSKTNARDVIVNSVLGLTVLTPNINNLPFQVCWKKNREFRRRSIKHSVRDFVACIQSPNPSWKEAFLKDMRELDNAR